ncbi:hypothetical protein K1T71_003549 [Dendrolimus kikuchii]|uniref:Uncharacterized protein n=1 Tax=Dendrolimus kikuchii TaxID=765133 RepID=A0ACC1DCL2_9NEOP|nr:hypothetical protein K1T71_003549 [Dendrolimus kikuchii]
MTILHVNYVFDTYPQYVLSRSKQTCENSSKTALVEHFFNVVFTEFHNTPPVCVCVQMCIGQATYCYPNGCLKRDDRVKKAALPEVAYQDDNQKPFVVISDQKRDFMDDLLDKNYVDDSKMAKVERPIYNELLSDPFKDKYKFVFQYKKLPKVQIKYNLREQVRNTKADVLKLESGDVLKSRWPVKRVNKIKENKIYSNLHMSPISNNKKFFMSLTPGNEVSDSAKYFKRDTNEVNIKAIYILENRDKIDQNPGFSLETLIDNLIEDTLVVNKTDNQVNITNGVTNNINMYESIQKNNIQSNDLNKIVEYNDSIFYNNNATEKYLNQNQIDYESDNNQLDSSTPPDAVDQLDTTELESDYYSANQTNKINTGIMTVKDISEKVKLLNETEIVSLNYTNENIKKNLYMDDTGNHTNILTDMITNLSKRIEKQNNTSLEMMRRYGYVEGFSDSDAIKESKLLKDLVTDDSAHDKPVMNRNTSDLTVISVMNSHSEARTTEKTTTNSYNFRATRKHRQRRMRMRNKKTKNYNK